ncbi:MAG: type II secretion system F family protein [Candidatus Pacearchaeota archaeon]
MEKKEEKGVGFYVRLSNFFFYKISSKLAEKDSLKKLKEDLRIAGIPIFSTSYLSIILFSSVLALVVGIMFSLFYSLVSKSSISNLMKNIGFSFAFAIVVFFGLYFYPSLEKKSLKRKIDEELPFVALQMSAISTSGLEPAKIFEILITDKESINVARELKKVVNQINIYGYDIVTALKNTSKETASQKLSELLSGMATTISEGGDLTEFLHKRSESLFFDYKLSRERYTKLAETFMNIYISIVITAPMIFSLLILLIGVSGFGLNLSPGILTFILSLGVSLINVVFLISLHLKQPSY